VHNSAVLRKVIFDGSCQHKYMRNDSATLPKNIHCYLATLHKTGIWCCKEYHTKYHYWHVLCRWAGVMWHWTIIIQFLILNSCAHMESKKIG